MAKKVSREVQRPFYDQDSGRLQEIAKPERPENIEVKVDKHDNFAKKVNEFEQRMMERIIDINEIANRISR